MLNIIKNIWQKEKIRLLLEQRKYIIEDWKHTYYLLRKTPIAIIGILIIFIFFFVAIFGPLLTSYDPTEQFLEERLQPPSLNHILGTDNFGRDIFSRIVYGTRIEVGVILIVSTISLTIGLIVGIIAGYFGGVVDEILMRITDMFLAFPRLILAMSMTAVLGPNLFNTMIAIGLVDWTIYARLTRSEAMKVKSLPYIEAIRAIGANDLRIIIFHVLPMSITPLIVQITLRMGTIIIFAAALGYLGLGAQPPTPEWGALVSDGRNYLVGSWWISTFPGIAISLVVFGFNFLGDGIRDILDPKLRR